MRNRRTEEQKNRGISNIQLPSILLNFTWTLGIEYWIFFCSSSSISVAVGQQVKAGSVIGKSGKSIDGEGAIIFMINNDKGTLFNPEQWLKPRR